MTAGITHLLIHAGYVERRTGVHLGLLQLACAPIRPPDQRPRWRSCSCSAPRFFGYRFCPRRRHSREAARARAPSCPEISDPLSKARSRDGLSGGPVRRAGGTLTRDHPANRASSPILGPEPTAKRIRSGRSAPAAILPADHAAGVGGVAQLLGGCAVVLLDDSPGPLQAGEERVEEGDITLDEPGSPSWGST